MRTASLLIFSGLVLAVLGFVLMFAAVGSPLPVDAGIVGVALVALGLILVLGGLLTHALRTPTKKELASQREDNHGTWHIRPRGLLFLGGYIGGGLALAFWAEQYLPGVASGDEPLAVYVLAIVGVVLLSFRKVRDLIFYTGEIPPSGVADPSENYPTTGESS